MMKLVSAARGAMLALGLSAFWAVPAALPASAQAVVEVDEDVIVGILKSEGLKAEIGYDEGTGAPYVATYWEKLKANFEVRLDACDEDGFFCEVMVFNAGFFFDKEPDATATHEKINEWNRNNWGKAYVDDEGTMWISIENNIVGGMTKDNIVDTLHWFESMMTDYTTFIDWQAN